MCAFRVEKNLSYSMHRLPAEVEGGKALSSCFSSYCKQVSFPYKSSTTFLAFVCCGMILLLIMAPKYSDEVLFRVTEDKKDVRCLMEKIHVFVSFGHELCCYWLSVQCWWINSVRACVLSCSVMSNCLWPHGHKAHQASLSFALWDYWDSQFLVVHPFIQ